MGVLISFGDPCFTDYCPRVPQRADTSSLQLFEDGLIRMLLLEVLISSSDTASSVGGMNHEL